MNTIDCVSLNCVIKGLYIVLFVRGSKICGSFGLAPPQQKLTVKTGNKNDKYGWDYKPLIVSCNS